MAETIPSTAPASPSWTNALGNLLNNGASIYSSFTNGQVANANSKSATKAAQAQALATQQQSSVMKYVLLGGGVLVAVVLVIILLKRK